MQTYEHITKMENILNTHTAQLQALNTLLDFVQQHRAEYNELIEYYYSDQRNQDLQDDDNHLIPQDLARGVLSEDAIFDLMGDYRDTALRLLETATDILKNP